MTGIEDQSHPAMMDAIWKERKRFRSANQLAEFYTQFGLEKDRFDPYFDHMLAYDDHTGEIIGVYRMLPGERAAELGQFYSEDEYDLSVLTSGGLRLLELGRSCVHRDYRTGAALHLL